MLRLDKFPTELLIIIFSYCSAFDFSRLSQVCKRFYAILRIDSLWNRTSSQLLVTNQNSERFRERCNPILSARSKWYISNNWQHGKYHKIKISLTEKGAKSWLQLTNDKLWLCTNSYVCYFQGAERFNIGKNMIYSNIYKNNFTSFVLTKDFVIISDSEGYLNFRMLDNYNVHCKMFIHPFKIQTIDATSDIILTVSDNMSIKLLHPPKTYDEAGRGDEHYVAIASITIKDSLFSIAIDPTGTKFCVGSSGLDNEALHIYDIQRFAQKYVMDYTWPVLARTVDMVWENPHTLLTCGLDGNIRKFDLRTRKCVKEWPNATKASIYCISSDHQYTMITGTDFKSTVVLWDQRQSHHVQIYFTGTQYERHRSPVYSLQFDSSRLYCITDKFLTKLKFSDYPRKEHNYKLSNDSE